MHIKGNLQTTTIKVIVMALKDGDGPSLIIFFSFSISKSWKTHFKQVFAGLSLFQEGSNGYVVKMDLP